MAETSINRFKDREATDSEAANDDKFQPITPLTAEDRPTNNELPSPKEGTAGEEEEEEETEIMITTSKEANQEQESGDAH